MPQYGIHTMVGIATQMWMPNRKWPGSLRIWMYAQFGLLALFTSLLYFMPILPLLYTIIGALYLVSMIAAMTIRMQQMVELV